MKVTLIPRGQARGLTWFVPGEDPTLISKQQIFARIVGALGGRAAEEIIFGDAEVTTGASSDLQQVSCIVFRSVDALKCLCAHLSIRILHTSWSACGQPVPAKRTRLEAYLVQWQVLLQVNLRDIRILTASPV